MVLYLKLNTYVYMIVPDRATRNSKLKLSKLKLEKPEKLVILKPKLEIL